jgi:hypothetical protein
MMMRDDCALSERNARNLELYRDRTHILLHSPNLPNAKTFGRRGLF